MRNRVAISLVVICLAAYSQAATLVAYDMAGQPGNQVSTAATAIAPGVIANAMVRGSGLTIVSGADSMNASSWAGPSADDFFQYGFTLAPGVTASVNRIQLSTRVSATGPGTASVLYSVDGGAETLLTDIVQPSTTFVFTSLDFPAVNVSSSFLIFVRSANNLAAGGGSVSGTGSMRIANYSPDAGGSFSPVVIEGSAIPEPAAAILAGGALLIVRRASRQGKP